MESECLDLYALQLMLREGIGQLFPEKLWVKAEISQISVRANGHCYMDLIQTRSGVSIAKAKAVIWRSGYAILSRCFKEVTGSALQVGMTILARVQVSYSELYGLSLVIDDLDPEVTVGENELRRQETIRKLTEDGMIDAQQSLPMAALPYRLAVISAADAAGYGDFTRHLDGNEYGFKFCTDLFEASMQGPSAPESISDALEAVQASEEPYDAVLIMRGGGSAFDLSCFDDYGLCFNIASCPVPVLTAIGHDRDYHVADMVAYRHFKTPTALADYFVDAYEAEDERLSSYVTRLLLAFSAKLSAMESRVEMLSVRIKGADPRNILSKGYSLVTDASGVVLKSASSVNAGDKLGILFKDGKIDCTANGKV